MTPFDEPAFTKSLRLHFRNCRQDLSADDLAHYFEQLKRYPLDQISRALEEYEKSDRKGSFPAGVAEVKKIIHRLQGAGQMAGTAPPQQSCGYDSPQLGRCPLVAVVWQEAMGARCSGHFLHRDDLEASERHLEAAQRHRLPPAPPQATLVLLARRLPAGVVLRDPLMGQAMLDWIDAHPEPSAAAVPPSESVKRSETIADVIPGYVARHRVPTNAEVLAARVLDPEDASIAEAYMGRPE